MNKNENINNIAPISTGFLKRETRRAQNNQNNNTHRLFVLAAVTRLCIFVAANNENRQSTNHNQDRTGRHRQNLWGANG